MRSTAAVLALAAGVAAGTASAARPVTLTLKVSGFPLVCGRPGGSLVIALPAAVELPRTIAAAAVRLNGSPAGRVAPNGRSVTVTAAAAKGASCYSIVLGRLAVVFTPAADVGSTSASGRYTVTVRHGTQTYRGTLTVSS